MNGLIAYDVDTQNDFMYKTGALSVPNAEKIIGNLEKLTTSMRKYKMHQIKSQDRHFGDEKHKHLELELKRWGGPFPDHCMDGTYGQRSIDATAPLNPRHITGPVEGELTDGELAAILNHPGELVVEKQSYDVFTNPKTEKVLSALGVKTAIVYGVATDYCVKAAVLGMRKLGIEVYLVTDAIEAVNVNQGDGEASFKEMLRAGAKPVTTNAIIKKLEFAYSAVTGKPNPSSELIATLLEAR
jgi:nicotinamidase/pyrazinamidase